MVGKGRVGEWGGGRFKGRMEKGLKRERKQLGRISRGWWGRGGVGEGGGEV